MAFFCHITYFFAFCFELIEKTFIFAIESFLITKKTKHYEEEIYLYRLRLHP